MHYFKKNKAANFKDLSDNELVKLIVSSGEDRYSKELYARYTNKVYGKCIILTKDKEISKDLTHDIFIKVFMNIQKFRGESDFSFWIHSVTYNHCISFLKKRNHIGEINEGLEQDITEENDREDNALKIRNHRTDLLEEVFVLLKEEDRVILMMYYKDGFSVKEIAQSLDAKESATKMRLKRARERLQKLLTSKEEEDYDR